MPSPELVVAASPYSSYQGGVIAVRAADFMGSARSGLSTVSDSLSPVGDAVLEEQQTSTDFFSGTATALSAADDTLVIPFADIPLEYGLTYAVIISLRITGDWDPTEGTDLRGSLQWRFANAVRLGWQMDGSPFWSTIRYYARQREHYYYTSAAFPFGVEEDQIMRWRGVSSDTTDIAIRVDQLAFFPLDSGFESIGLGADAFQGFAPADGADGGDDHSVYTYSPRDADHSQAAVHWMDFSGSDGGGDYQRKSGYDDAEKVIDITADNGFQQDAMDQRFHYCLAGTNYLPPHTVLDDDFGRAVADGWGVGPQGFGWWRNQDSSSVTVKVEGGEGIMHHVFDFSSGTTAAELALKALTGFDSHLAAGVNMRDFEWTGKFKISGTIVDSGGGAGDIFTVLTMRWPSGGPVAAPSSNDQTWQVAFDWSTKTWRLAATGIAIPSTFHGPVDISSWWGLDDWVAWKVRRDRHRLRVKIWDASGAEPGTWDFDDGMPIKATVGATLDSKPYPYTGFEHLAYSLQATEGTWLSVNGGSALGPALWNFKHHWDDIKIVYDPGEGDPQSSFLGVQQPNDGAKVGEIELPYGAMYMVNLGRRVWNAMADPFELGFESPFLDYAARVWNHLDAPDLQRAEYLWSYFRVPQMLPTLVSMNWRSSARDATATRVNSG